MPAIEKRICRLESVREQDDARTKITRIVLVPLRREGEQEPAEGEGVVIYERSQTKPTSGAGT